MRRPPGAKATETWSGYGLHKVLCALLLLTATAQTRADHFYYITNNGTLTIIAAFFNAGGLTIPSTIDGLPVTAIAGGTLQGEPSLTSVTFPETLTSIGSLAFGFSGLTNVTLPNSVTSLGELCFAACSNLQTATLSSSLTSLPLGTFADCPKLAGIAIPNSVTNIDNNVFSRCVGLTNVSFGNSLLSIGVEVFSGCSGLTNVILPASLSAIGENAFSDCNGLSSISIPAGTKTIAVTAFTGCAQLKAINVDPANETFSSVDGVVLNKTRTTVLLCPPGKAGTYMVPNSVTNIGQMSFSNCSQLTNVVFGDSVATIEAHAFEGCVGLTCLVLPDSLTTIQDGPVGKSGTFGVFYGCTGLTNVTFGKGLTYLGVGAFFNCTNLVAAYFHGDAPVLGGAWPRGYGDLFFGSSATAYYLPGTTGWGMTLADHPAVLWNPVPQIHDASFGLKPSGFGFNIAGTADIPLVVEACTSLPVQSWAPLQTCTLTNGLIYFSDPQWTNYPSRFYRIRSP